MSKRPTDDLIPAAKKRFSDRQITKDDAESEEEEEVDPNNFQRASEDVLKQRKIVKARRGAGGSTSAAETADADAAAKPANPFAGIQLQPPTGNPFSGVSLVAPSQAAASAPAEKPKEDSTDAKEPSTTATASDKKEEGPAGGSAGAPAGTGTFLGAPAAGGFAALASTAPLGGFGGFGAAAAAGTNVFGGSAKPAAFGAGLAGTSAPAFAFGAAAQASTAAPTNGTSAGFTFPSLGGAKANGDASAQPAPAADTVRSIFGAPTGHISTSDQDAAQDAAAAAVSLGPAENAKTGEEDETNVFAGEGALFEFDLSKTWRERGRGDMKINVSKDSGAARMVMRQKGNLRLLMNAALFPEMVVAKMEGGKAVTFACVNGAAQATEGGEGGSKEGEGPPGGGPEGAAKEGHEVANGVTPKLTTWAFRIKPQDKLEEFMACLLEHKGAHHEEGTAADAQ